MCYMTNYTIYSPERRPLPQIALENPTTLKSVAPEQKKSENKRYISFIGIRTLFENKTVSSAGNHFAFNDTLGYISEFNHCTGYCIAEDIRIFAQTGWDQRNLKKEKGRWARPSNTPGGRESRQEVDTK
jgi:hypothetical protein